VVHVWTPTGSAKDVLPQPLVDRYVAAVDAHGVISTGHAALEASPDIYISHYPAQEIDHSPDDFRQLLRATHENNVAGRFQPSYAVEAAGWCPSTAEVVFERYNDARLGAFWAWYRHDDTYNLTNRNCSSTVAAALESALEGTLGEQLGFGAFLGALVKSGAVGCRAAAPARRIDGLDTRARARLRTRAARGHQSPAPRTRDAHCTGGERSARRARAARVHRDRTRPGCGGDAGDRDFQIHRENLKIARDFIARGL
jgi:hypothetical protein